jgi:hypothetical protein
MALPAQTEKINIDIDRIIGEIDPKISEYSWNLSNLTRSGWFG